MRLDPVAIGIASFWKYKDASILAEDQTLECDVVVIGSGAGGAASAAMLASSGYKVIIVEEGPLKHNQHFKMLESDAYPDLYQESMARVTKDGGISILQGRNVGGSTTINWTTSFRTPHTTLNHWENVYGVQKTTVSDLTPLFEAIERKYSIEKWKLPPNLNNQKIKTGCDKLGIKTGVISRNVSGCANLGYCGLGCPLGAKKGSLLTTIPEAMKHGATLVTKTRAHKLIHSDGEIKSLECRALLADRQIPSGVTITINAKQFVLAGGAIGSPSLVLRSDLDDSNDLVGKRTFLHPVAAVAARHKDEIHPYQGAPQSIYSDHFLTNAPEKDPIGYKLEAAPLHPILASSVIQGHGQRHLRPMTKLSHTSNIIALLRDGFHEESPGGEVFLKSDGTAGLDYEFNEYMWDGVKRAYLTMAEIMFESGAEWVTPIHASSNGFGSWNEAKRKIPELAYEMLEARLFSAHVMGGMPFGEDKERTVCDSYGSYRDASNLTVVDGSIFPTSIGTNPQVSIYAFAERNTRALIQKMRSKTI